MIGRGLVERAWVGELESRGTKVGGDGVIIQKDLSVAQDSDLGLEV